MQGLRMKKFQFKLQAVLTLRQRAEQSALEAYGRATLARQVAMSRLADADKELAQAWTDLHLDLDQGCAAAQARKAQDYCRFLGEKKRKCEQGLGRAEVDLNQAFQKMILARQDREAVEQYLGGQIEQHDRALRAEERKTIEDIVQRRSTLVISWKTVLGKHWN
jgi:flagellar FliJ protein